MKKPHILVVEARFYEDIADELFAGAAAALEAAGATFERVAVPGAFEVPAAIEFALAGQPGRFDGFLGLGCVIRGETTHYDYVCEEAARGMQDIALRHKAAVGFGILTVENDDQAWARANRSKKDKGGEVARAVLRMIELRHHFNVA